MNLSTLTGRPAHDGGCYHCDRGAKPCICPGKLLTERGSQVLMSGQMLPETARKAAVFDEWIAVQHERAAPVAQQGTDEMSKYHVYPRRRDVRDLLIRISTILSAKGHIEIYGEIVPNREVDEKHGTEEFSYVDFDRDFLTGVRDLMREGVPFEDAIGAFDPEIAEDPAS